MWKDLGRGWRASGVAVACAVSLAAVGCGGRQESASPQTTAAQEAVAQEQPAAAGEATVAACDAPFQGSSEQGLPTEYPAPQSEALTLGLLNPNGATEVVRVIYDAAKSRIAELGGTAIELDAELNPDTQVSQFEQLLNQDVDAIGITAILGPNVLGPLLAKAEAAGIPVVALELTVGSPERVPGVASQIWQQRDRFAYLQVKAACEALPAGSQVALIGLAVPVPLFQFMVERQRYWAEQFGLEVVDQADSPNDTVEGGTEVAAGLLARNPDIEAILGYNDEPAVGAALAAKVAGRPEVMTFGVVAGSLGRGAIENGRLTASVYHDSVDEGDKLAVALYGAAQGLELPPVVLSGAPYIVTEANVDDAQ